MIPIFRRDHGEDPANRCPISAARELREQEDDRCGHFSQQEVGVGSGVEGGGLEMRRVNGGSSREERKHEREEEKWVRRKHLRAISGWR